MQHLNTFAKDATELEPDQDDSEPASLWQSWGGYLGVSFAISNPRKIIKRAKYLLGNLPLEILNHLIVYCNSILESGNFN